MLDASSLLPLPTTKLHRSRWRCGYDKIWFSLGSRLGHDGAFVSRPDTQAERTRMWIRPTRVETADPLQELRAAIATLRKRPGDPDARHRVRSVADDPSLRETLAVVLADEATACSTQHRDEAAAALFEVLADVHEDLDQPLEAIAAMEQVVRHVSDRTELHDRLAWLYRRAGAWAKAAAEFVRVGELATDERGRAALRAAGRLYREHGKLERAAELYREVLERRPSDDQIWRELDEVYAELARWPELAEVRAMRAAHARSSVQRAALLRSQARALEQAGLLAEAARAVEEATTHAPNDLSGLVDHADMLARSGRGEEAAKLLRARIADATNKGADAEHVAAMRLQLVGVLEDLDRDAAIASLEELLAEAPDHIPALERAAAFAAASQDPKAHAKALLRYAAALSKPEPEVIAAAARRFRDAGDHAAAARALSEALHLRPEDEQLQRELDDTRAGMKVSRVIEEANAMMSAGRLDAAAAFLYRTLEELEDAPDAQLATLIHHYARAQAALGDDDEAHRLLHEAHRLDRHSLAIRLALGESCYARRLWREAVRYLAPLAEHPDAATRATAVATGLVHAATAETRSLRPANALAHVEKAVRIDPKCGPAWHALAQDAIERGDLERAADCLEREAEGATDDRDRIRLFDALGDMARDVLGDLERAERCWAQLVDIAEAPILDKLLATQRKRGSAARAHTCLRLADIAGDATQRKALLEEAAEMLAADGKHARALEVAERVMSAHPNDVTSLTCAADVALAAGDPSRAASWLRPQLARVRVSPDEAPRVAALWRKLGDAERALGALPAARRAYTQAAAVAPSSDGALAARRGLVELDAEGEHATSPVSLQSSLFALVEAQPERDDVLALARELAGRDPDHARATYELARALGARLSEDDDQFYASHPPRALAPDEVYATRLSAADRRELIDDPDDAPLTGVLEIVGEAMRLVCPDAKTALLDAGYDDATRVPVTGDVMAAAILPQIAKAIDGPAVLLYSSERAPQDIELVLASPPVIVLGPDVVEDDDPTELRFLLGRVVELARPHRVFAGGQSDADFAALVAAITTFDPRAARPRATRRADAAITRDAEWLRSKLPVVVRQRLTERLTSLSEPLDPDRYTAACARAADRAGMLACGQIDVAVELAGGASVARHLIELATSRAYIDARRRLRTREGRDVDDVTSPFSR